MEFAIILPVLVIFTLGTIDVCSVIFLKESVVLAAYEGARQGVDRGKTNADATSRVSEFLADRGISGGSSSIGGAGFDAADTLEHVSVTVTVPTADNLVSPTWLFGDFNISATCTMRKEYKNLDE